MLFPLILIYSKEKKVQFFYNNFGIRAVIIYFCFVLIGFINDYKHIYSRNVYLGVCGMIFMKVFFSIKNCYESIREQGL